MTEGLVSEADEDGLPKRGSIPPNENSFFGFELRRRHMSGRLETR